MGAHRGERRDLLGVEPGEERAHGDGISRAGVRVADVGGEEIEKPQAGVLAGLGDQLGNERTDPPSQRDDDRLRREIRSLGSVPSASRTTRRPTALCRLPRRGPTPRI